MSHAKCILVMLRSDPDSWVRQLQLALPAHRVLAGTAVAGSVDYAVVGKPPPGALAALERLQVVFSVNAGVEALLESQEVPDQIPIVRMADDGLAEGMLEWVLATTLAWHRNLFAYRTAQGERRWAPLPEELARNRRVTVLGAGHLGGRVAGLLAQLKFDTRVWSRTRRDIPGVASLAGPDALHAAVCGSDFLINLLPLTPATENLLDARLLSLLNPGAVLINGGRGRHLVDEDVIALLDRGALRAAVLDVFRQEPLPETHPFWHHPGVYLTPHVAAPTHVHTAVAVIAQNIRRLEGGAGLHHVVDRSRGY